MTTLSANGINVNVKPSVNTRKDSRMSVTELLEFVNASLGPRHGLFRILVDEHEKISAGSLSKLLDGCKEAATRRADAIRVYCEYFLLYAHDKRLNSETLREHLLHARDATKHCTKLITSTSQVETPPANSNCLKCRVHKGNTLIMCDTLQEVVGTLLDPEMSEIQAALEAITQLKKFEAHHAETKRVCAEDASVACRYACTGNLFADALASVCSDTFCVRSDRVIDAASTLTREECINKQLANASKILKLLEHYVQYLQMQKQGSLQ